MNKAFVREPESTADRCPRCGSIGQAVGAAVLDTHVRPEARSQLGETASFCPSETCPIVYFDAFERAVRLEDLVAPAYPKDPAAPMCACFGFTRADVEEDVREGSVTRTRSLLERAKSPDARCAQLAPNGQSCVSQVQRYFMKRRGGA